VLVTLTSLDQSIGEWYSTHASLSALPQESCFVAGTRLLDASGAWIPVQSLRAGHMMHTSEGAAAVAATHAWVLPLDSAYGEVFRVTQGTHGATRGSVFLSRWHRLQLESGERQAAFRCLPRASREELARLSSGGALLHLHHLQVEGGADLFAEGACRCESWDGKCSK